MEASELLIGTGLSSAMLRLPGNESLTLRIDDQRLEIPGLARSIDGLTILQISDLHFSRAYRRRFFELVFELAAAEPADLVLFTGDLLDDDDARDWIRPVFSRISGRLGSYAILGNHDNQHAPERSLEELGLAGFESVDGLWKTLRIGDSTLAIGGTRKPWGPLPQPGDALDADFRILLSHTPDLLELATRWGVDLMLSGHNHGGQVRLPAVGPVLMPSRFGRRYDRAFFKQGKTLLHVSAGVGGKHPIRYNCTPEIARLVLSSAEIKSEERANEARNQEKTNSAAVVA